MLQSILDDAIEYIEDKEIEELDKGKQVSLYELEIFGIKLVLTIGNINNEHKSKNILYTPVYLVVSKDSIEKIVHSYISVKSSIPKQYCASSKECKKMTATNSLLSFRLFFLKSIISFSKLYICFSLFLLEFSLVKYAIIFCGLFSLV